MHVTMILVGAGLILLTVSPLTDAGVYRFGTEKLRVKFEWNKEGSIHDMMAEAEYLANNSSPLNSSSRKRATHEFRSGHSTTTNTCNHVRGVPAGLRRADVMRPDGLDNFYQKYTEAYGIPVLSSSLVPDDALKRACYTVRFMLADNSAIRESFYRLSGRVAIMAASEVTLDIPEHSHLDEHMNQRARGLGATITEPVSTGAEENVLCEDHDRYHREDIFLHEFAHAIDGLGANIVIPNWHQKRQHVYNHAKSTGLWNNTYAMTNPAEYFAEGVQSFFNVNDHANPTNGIHNDIDTQAELKHYDPQLYNLILEVFPCNNHYLKRCGTTRHQEQTQHIKMDCNTVHYTFPENTDPNCQDERVECLSWSRTGECHSNPSYMEHHCKASCNVCTQAAAGQCTDSNTNCPDWARSGECENNPGYMLHSCKYSCENCDGSKLIGR